VVIEAYKLGVLWQGIWHDWHKFLPDEWFPYAEFFYGFPETPKGSYGERPPKVKKAFLIAWLKHQHRGRHHWQYWVLRKDDGEIEVFEMPDKYVREMIADWRGAGRAITGKKGAKEWYENNKENIKLHPWTRMVVETHLADEGEDK
jgi:hypothetical protein